MVGDAQGIEKFFLSNVWAPLGSKVESLKKVKKFTDPGVYFLNNFLMSYEQIWFLTRRNFLKFWENS